MHDLNWNVKQAWKNLRTIGILSNTVGALVVMHPSVHKASLFWLRLRIRVSYISQLSLVLMLLLRFSILILGREWKAYCCIAKQETYDVSNSNSTWIFPFSEFYQTFKKITAFRSLLWIGVEDLLFEINEENNLTLKSFSRDKLHKIWAKNWCFEEMICHSLLYL